MTIFFAVSHRGNPLFGKPDHGQTLVALRQSLIRPSELSTTLVAMLQLRRLALVALLSSATAAYVVIRPLVVAACGACDGLELGPPPLSLNYGSTE